jgi:mannose-6-phosphate isomerase class I
VLAELYVGFRPLEAMDDRILGQFKADYAAQPDDASRRHCFQTHYAQALERGRTDSQGLEVKAYSNRFEVRREKGCIELYLNDRKQPDSIKHLYGLHQDGLVVNIPGTTPHVLQKGMVYELQQMTDQTLRLYDNGRNDPDRPLHIEEALEKLDFTLRPPEEYLIQPQTLDPNQVNLIRTDYYYLDKIRLTNQGNYPVNLEGCYQILVVIYGQGQLIPSDNAQKPLLLSQGDMILIPAQLTGYSLQTSSQLTLLKIHE